MSKINLYNAIERLAMGNPGDVKLSVKIPGRYMIAYINLYPAKGVWDSILFLK